MSILRAEHIAPTWSELCIYRCLRIIIACHNIVYRDIFYWGHAPEEVIRAGANKRYSAWVLHSWVN